MPIKVQLVFISGMKSIGVAGRVGINKGRSHLKKAIPSKELAGWLFNILYWLEALKIHKARWRKSAFEKYIKCGMSKKYPKGTFKKTWCYIKKEGLIRKGEK